MLKKIILTILLAFFILLTISILLNIPAISQEGNPWPQIKGIVSLYFPHNDLVRLSGDANRYISRASDGFDAVKAKMEVNGYRFTEQMGSGYFFQSSDGQGAVVTRRQYTRFFTIWSFPSEMR